jgi:mediator of RNA polymerase II transcription subunit 17, fungi type
VGRPFYGSTKCIAFFIDNEPLLIPFCSHTLRLTFVSPSSLTIHLPQATLTIPSIPQLCQLLSSEIESCLLSLICELGNELCRDVDGTWFVDLVKSRSVGRWEGCVM